MYPIKADKLKVESKYGYRTYKYQGKLIENEFHKGIDLNALPFDNKVEIIAVEDGEVTSVRKTGEQYGNMCYVRIKHKNGYYTVYYHLKTSTIKLNKGDKVKKGDVLGIIGTTGKSTGIHLHFQIDKGDKTTAIDPYDFVFNNKSILDINKKEETQIKKGTYQAQMNINVRTGAGVEYPNKLVRNMTLDGQKNALYTKPTDKAIYKKGTRFTVSEIIQNKNGSIWGKTPSGYVCIIGSDKIIYSKKV